MEIILIKDVEEVGKRGDVVRVRDGFARNFLLPQKMAMAANRSNRVFVEEQRARAAKRQVKERAAAQLVANKLSEVQLVVASKVGEKEKLFGSVTNEDVCQALNAKGYQFQRKQIHLKEPIRTLGSFQVTVDVFQDVKAKVNIDVVPQTE